MAEFVSSPEASFSEEELAAVRETKSLLLAKGIPVSSRELLLTVINCKLRADTSVKKYIKWLESLKDFGITSFDDVWKDLPRDGSSDEHSIWEKMAPFFESYAGCGRDLQNRSIMWIKSRPIPIGEEAMSIRAGIIFYSAIHADMTSLREGITFVIDTTSNSMGLTGNEAKLQKSYQSIPLRPQNIYILGAGYLKRLLINTVISIASLFTSEKVIERIRFAELSELKSTVAEESMPTYVGGGGGGILTNEQLVLWIKNRLAQFPTFPDDI